MAAQVKVTFTQDLTAPVKIRHYDGMAFTGDDSGNVIGVELFNAGVPYSDGGTVSATAILADGSTYALTQGTITGNVVSVPLEAGALAVPGRMGLYVKLTGDSIECTVLSCVFSVVGTDTGVAPATAEASVNELIAALEDARDTFPSDLTQLQAAVAPTFSTYTAYAAGAYVWQNGTLYKFTQAHSAGSWTGADAVAAAVGLDVAELKSAIEDLEGFVSDGSTLLSDVLTDKEGTSAEITYTLTGNTTTIVGTATSGSTFTILGSTTAAPPSWMVSGGKYFLHIENSTPVEARFQAKTTAQTSIYTFARFTNSGNYILTIPVGITAFRLMLAMSSGASADGSITLEISNVIPSKDLVEKLSYCLSGNKNDAVTIPSNSDFNNYSAPGNFKVESVAAMATMSNRPSDTPGRLFVLNTYQTTAVIQMWYEASARYAFIRRYVSSWTDWIQILPVDVIENGVTAPVASGTVYTALQQYETKYQAALDALRNHSVNLYSKFATDFVDKKGFSGTTGDIVTAANNEITGYIPIKATDYVMVLANGIDIYSNRVDGQTRKIALYNASKEWQSTKSYSTASTFETVDAVNYGIDGYIRVMFRRGDTNSVLVSSVQKDKLVDLVVFAGQSNMAGRGVTSTEFPETAPAVIPGAGYEFKSITDPTKLYPITEPFGYAENAADDTSGIYDGTNKTGDMIPAFVNAYYTNNGNVPVVGVSASEGGSSSIEWQPGTGNNFVDLAARVNTARAWLADNAYSIRHQYCVWCQGESDGDNINSGTETLEEYETRALAIFSGLIELGLEKVLLVRIGHCNVSSTSTRYKAIIDWQTDEAKTNENLVLVSCDFAAMRAKGMMKDNFHYYQIGYNITGNSAGINSAFYATTGKEPTMYDPENDNLYYSHKD